MKVLHICNDFSYSKVHTNLYRSLDRQGVSQVIFHPLRNKANVGKNVFLFETDGSEVVYSELLKIYHRILFRRKISKLYNSLKTQVDLSEITIQHATTLFSDGAVALKIFKKFRIPYIVTLRNTDVNLFLKYRPDLYSLGKEILLNANKIVFLSPSLKHLFFENFYFRKIQKVVETKISVIPNGIDEYWLNNITLPKPDNAFNFLFIGRFDRNKNVLRLIQALEGCRKDYPALTLTLVGGGGDLHNQVILEIENRSWIKFEGLVYEKARLKELFEASDFFTMASIFESFGLVYLEALSQGLPILYTEGQGIDGVFDQQIGVATDPLDVQYMQKQILQLIVHASCYKLNISKIDFSRFDWNNIGRIYFEIFKS